MVTQWQWRAGNRHRYVVLLLTPTTSPSLNVVPNAPQDQLRDAKCHLAIMTEDIDKISFAYDNPIKRCRPFPNYFSPALVTGCAVAQALC